MKLVDLTTAQALQELGYDGECNRWYNRDGKLKPTHLVDDDIPAPRLDDVAYWLREHYKILITIDYVWYDGYQYTISQNFAATRPNIILSVDCDTYDSALEAAVTEAIEIIKDNKL